MNQPIDHTGTAEIVCPWCKTVKSNDTIEEYRKYANTKHIRTCYTCLYSYTIEEVLEKSGYYKMRLCKQHSK